MRASLAEMASATVTMSGSTCAPRGARTTKHSGPAGHLVAPRDGGPRRRRRGGLGQGARSSLHPAPLPPAPAHARAARRLAMRGRNNSRLARWSSVAPGSWAVLASRDWSPGAAISAEAGGPGHGRPSRLGPSSHRPGPAACEQRTTQRRAATANVRHAPRADSELRWYGTHVTSMCVGADKTRLQRALT